MRRPLLLGLDNPYSTDPRNALLPRPSHSAGGRLFRLASMPWSEYNATFERRNICDVTQEELTGRTVVVLGREAWRRLGLSGTEFFDRTRGAQPDTLFILIPHPSGRNLWYNSSKNRYRVRRLLRRLARCTQTHSEKEGR